MEVPEMGATSVNGNRWWGTDKKPGQVRSPKVRYVCTMQRPIPFSCKTERVNERASGSACVCLHGWDCDGMRPEASCLGPLLDILRYSLRAGCWVQCRGPFPSLVHGSRTRTPVKQSSLVVSSLLPGPWVGGNGIRRWTAPLQSECDSRRSAGPHQGLVYLLAAPSTTHPHVPATLINNAARESWGLA